MSLLSEQGVLAPGIDQFAARIAQAYANHPDFAGLSYAEQRRVAELVRSPWRQGGPEMVETLERTLAPSGLRLRIYRPVESAPQPALVYMHGGGWTFFSLDTHDRVMREYAARSRLPVVGVDYPLSPEAKFPTALERVLEAVDWLGAEGETVGVDGSRLALGGDSAGANLALSAALALRDRATPSPVEALILNYGAFDPVSSDEAERAFGGYMLNRAEMAVFWANYLPDARDAANTLACPLRADLTGAPPTFLTIPELDLLTEQSLELARRLEAAGVEVRAELYQGATHSFLEAVSVAEVAARALEDASAWLSARLDVATRAEARPDPLRQSDEAGALAR